MCVLFSFLDASWPFDLCSSSSRLERAPPASMQRLGAVAPRPQSCGAALSELHARLDELAGVVARAQRRVP